MEIYLNYMATIEVLKGRNTESTNNLKDGENMLARFYRNEKPVYVNINMILMALSTNY